MERKHDQVLVPAHENSDKSIARFEALLIQKKITTIDFARHCESIHKECEKIGLEKLVAHPYIMALWSRAHFAMGNYYDVLNLSRATVSLIDKADHGDLFREEYLLQTKAHLALSDVHEAEASLTQACGWGQPDARQLFVIELLSARISMLKGDANRAQSALQDARTKARDLVQSTQIRTLEGVYEVMFSGGVNVARFADIESSNPEQLSFPAPLERAFREARLLLAHIAAQSGQLVRAQELVSPCEGVSSWASPGAALVLAEIELLKGDFPKATRLIRSGSVLQRCGLTIQEQFEFRWINALVVLAHVSSEAFAMEAARLERAMRGCGSSYYKMRARLLAALGAVLTHEYHAAHMLLAGLDNRLIEESNVCSLLAFLCKGIEAHRLGEFDSFWEEARGHNREKFVSGDACLCALVCAHAHPVMCELILKSQLHGSGAFKLVSRLREERIFSRAHIGILSDKEWRQILGMQDDLRTEQTGTYTNSAPFRITLLGSLGVEYRGQKTLLSGWGRSKTRELFTSLVLQAGKEISRDEMLDRLWPDKDIKPALNCYYVAWSQMKRYLKSQDEHFLALFPAHSSSAHGYLDRGCCNVDIIEFEEYVHNARMAALQGDDERALASYQHANELYRGDLLPGDTHLEWLTQPREYFHTLYVEAMIAATELCLKRDEANRAIQFVEDALHKDRNREKLYELAMRAYARASRREEALKAYLDCKSYLSEELGLDPSAHITELYIQLISE